MSNEAPEGVIPDSVRLSFYLGAAVFFVAVLWTVIKSKEYSPEEMASFEENQEREGFAKAIHGRPRSTRPTAAGRCGWARVLFIVGTPVLEPGWPAELYQVMILSAGMVGFVGVTCSSCRRSHAEGRPIRQRLSSPS